MVACDGSVRSYLSLLHRDVLARPSGRRAFDKEQLHHDNRLSLEQKQGRKEAIGLDNLTLCYC